MDSSLARIVASLTSATDRESLSSGVLPIRSQMLSAIFGFSRWPTFSASARTVGQPAKGHL